MKFLLICLPLLTLLVKLPSIQSISLCPLIICRECVECFGKNETLIKSPCGCCFDKCVECPPKKECLQCIFKCQENETLVEDPCDCCNNVCEPSSEECPPNVCSTVKCAPPSECPKGYILVEGAGYCGCCPGCVNPVLGDPCYKNLEGSETCGDKLQCCEGKCVDLQTECFCPPRTECLLCIEECPKGETLVRDRCDCCFNYCQKNEQECPPDICQLVRCGVPECPEGTIIAQGAGFCGCCPGCVKPGQGDQCYFDLEGALTCGKNLICCNGTCADPLRKCPLICGDVPCPKLNCSAEQTIVQGPGCCAECVFIKEGDKCYRTTYGQQTCGDKLVCCGGVCKGVC